MSSLYDNKLKIKKIDHKNLDWRKIISDIYKNNENGFYKNSELIDVKDRFRYVATNEKSYIIKKTTKQKGKREVLNALKLHRILENKVINNYKLRVIVPNIIVIGSESYLISEYMGHTLQELLYDKEKTNALSKDSFLSIIKLLFKEKIVYKGFIPRNIIINNNIIYMIDFEDVLFNEDISIDLPYITNFVLNWQYFYDRSLLFKLISSLNVKDNEIKKLNDYEKKYKILLGSNESNKVIREKILEMVLISEKPCKYMHGLTYEIMPNDLAHLISDLFGYKVDMFFDFLCQYLRNMSEKTYYDYLKLFSKIIYLEKYNIKKLKFYILIIITMIMETILYETNLFEISDGNFYNEFESKIINHNFVLSKYILQCDKNKLNLNLKNVVKKLLFKLLNNDLKYKYIYDDLKLAIYDVM